MSYGPLVLIDGHNLFIRNYVVGTLLTSDGERCGGTVGTVNSVKKILADYRPSNVLVVWDGEGGSQRRKAIYGAYKEGRTIRMNRREDDMEEDPEASLENMRKQRQDAADYLSLLGIPQVRCDGVEADDLIAYIAGKMDHPHGCVIVTTDKDMLQLISEPRWEHDCVSTGGDTMVHSGRGSCEFCGAARSSEVKVYSPVKRVMYDRQTFISEHRGILPENYRLVKALAGDKSDNIDGVKGFGEATIAKLFPVLSEKPVSLDELLELARDIKTSPTTVKRLFEEESRLRENLELMDLSDPMLSATAARHAREAMSRDVGCREMELRLRTKRDGVNLFGSTAHDAAMMAAFREFVIRRRKLLADCQGGGDGDE